MNLNDFLSKTIINEMRAQWEITNTKIIDIKEGKNIYITWNYNEELVSIEIVTYKKIITIFMWNNRDIGKKKVHVIGI